MSEYQKTGKIVVSAMKADVHPQTAKKYVQAAKPPEELQAKHTWRTRADPISEIWPKAEQMLEDAPELEAKELFDHLCRRAGDEVKVEESALRTFQRRVRSWHLKHGPDKEVYFEQEHLPGKVMQLDWTNANSLRVTIRGKVPRELRVDNSSAATHRIGGQAGRDFNQEFASICAHYGLEPKTIQIDSPEENGDVEASNGHLKRRLTQHLLLRGSREFSSENAYDQFLEAVMKRSNDGRQARLTDELAAMKPLPPTRLSEYDEVYCTVGWASTIRVKKVGYSVPARLIGSELKVEVYEHELKLYSGRELLLTLPRHCGDRGVRLNYRHVIDHLLRKPGAFERYRYREQLFLTPIFRRAYDQLVQAHGTRRGAVE